MLVVLLVCALLGTVLSRQWGLFSFWYVAGFLCFAPRMRESLRWAGRASRLLRWDWEAKVEWLAVQNVRIAALLTTDAGLRTLLHALTLVVPGYAAGAAVLTFLMGRAVRVLVTPDQRAIDDSFWVMDRTKRIVAMVILSEETRSIRDPQGGYFGCRRCLR